MANRDLTSWTAGRGLSAYERDPFTTFRRQVDQLFDGFWAPGEARSFAPTPSAGWLTLDLSETPQAYRVIAELPGIDEKDIEVTLRDNALTIRGEKRDESNGGEDDRVYIERSYGRFERTIPFNTTVDADQIQVSSRNGVLTVTVPKNPQAKEKSKRIKIKRQTS